MAPLIHDEINGNAANIATSAPKPRIAIVGAGSRGEAYARATTDSGLGTVVAVIEPKEFKRNLLGSKYIWRKSNQTPDQAFKHLEDFIKHEQEKQHDKAAGLQTSPGVDGVLVCVRDELHVQVVTALAPLGLHIMCEKPLATTLRDCLRIQRALEAHPQRVFAVGHVLRYSPHNMTLRDLILNKKVIGDVISIEHTEPVGWWHFSHSYVRGNWRKESVTAPSLLTKSCHDIDWILWMLCSPPAGIKLPPHLPNSIASLGSLKQFRRSRKPKEAGNATNCLACPIRDSCMYSAKHIYYDIHLAEGNTHWPVDIVNPEIETIVTTQGLIKGTEALMSSLEEDYDASTTPLRDIESRSWFGRCVWDSDNDVCDDQHVVIEWEDDVYGRGAKTASFHMVAQTQNICERRGRIYGSMGEVQYDSNEIVVHDFQTNAKQIYNPEVPTNSHHGGGDIGLTTQFLEAIAAVKSGEMEVEEAQVQHMGVTIEEAVRSHAAVFAAEDARREKTVVNWREWWKKNVDSVLDGAM